MPIVPIFETLKNDFSCVTLPRYAQIMQYPETAFFGVRRDEDLTGDCREIWTKRQRDMVSRALWEAQQEIEKHINYFLSPRWIVDEEHPYYRSITYTKKTKFIEAGYKALTLLGNESLDHTNDPATLTITLTTAYDLEEIKIYHPGTTVEIIPSSMEYSGLDLTIEIPRARLVMLNSLDNPSTGWDYNDTGIYGAFEQSVDIYRVYNDNTNALTLVWRNGKSGSCDSCNEEESTDGCLNIVNKEKGFIKINTSELECVCLEPTSIKLSYCSGLLESEITEPIIDAIIRLAHTKMPIQPCGCDSVVYLWKQDRAVPDVLTAERLNCPFGVANGAFLAWQMVSLVLKTTRGLSL